MDQNQSQLDNSQPKVDTRSILSKVLISTGKIILVIIISCMLFIAGNITGQRGYGIPFTINTSLEDRLTPITSTIDRLPFPTPSEKIPLKILGIYETKDSVIVFSNTEAYATMYHWLRPGQNTESYLPYSNRFDYSSSGGIIKKGMGYKIKIYQTETDKGITSETYIFKGNRSVIENPECPYAKFVLNQCGQDTDTQSAAAEKNNSKRMTDISSIINALKQYEADYNGLLPTIITETESPISKSAVDLCGVLVTKYLASLPTDPSVNNSVPIFAPNCNSAYVTGYTIKRDRENNSLTVSAPKAELGVTISVVR